MPFNENYRRQAALLVRIVPLIAPEQCFALKGGTAINLFIRDMPRLSVDIDLTYLPVRPRPASLSEIDAAMRRIAERARQSIPDPQVTQGVLSPERIVNKLFVRAGGVQVKIEVTPVLRGCVFEPEQRRVSPAVEATFGFAEMAVVSFADLYGGKIVAALDRQHPRDLFDIRDLLAHEGIDASLRQAVIVYLLSHDRPMAEVLRVRRKNIDAEFVRGFQGMTDETVSVAELAAAREMLVERIVGDMPEDQKRFLISFERGEPNWSLLRLPDAAKLPAIKWRQQNLDKLSSDKRSKLVADLESVLSGKTD